MAANNDAAALSKQRRRLSVQSDSKFIEGVENMDISGGGKARRQSIQIREGEAGHDMYQLRTISMASETHPGQAEIYLRF